MRATEPAAVRQTFERCCRILRRHEFLRIQGKGQRFHSRHFVFQFLPGEGRQARLGITVSKKVGNAVVRNRIKRWVREAFRRHPELRPGAPGAPGAIVEGDPRRPYDLVITAKRDAGTFDWKSVHDELVQQLARFLGPAERRSRRSHERPEGGGKGPERA